MSGFDPEAIFDAIAARFDNNTIGVEAVYPFPSETPPFAALGLFPANDFIDYWGSFGDNRAGTLNLELRTVFSFGAEESMRNLCRMLASGDGHDRSIIDVLLADRTLDGLVQDLIPRGAFIEGGGPDSPGTYIGVIPVQVIMKRRSA